MKLSRRDFIKASAAAAAVSMAGLPVKKVLADTSIKYTSAQCRFCGVGCTVLAGVKDGKMVAVKGDPDSMINFGRLCMKGYSLPHIMYGEDRLTKPMVRQADGSYKTVTWDAALDLIADKFTGLVKEHGPDAKTTEMNGRKQNGHR
jgi:nitrate reductase NapA